jgi:hypothetical protein
MLTRRFSVSIATLALAMIAPAVATIAQDAPSTMSLSDAQKADILSHNSEESVEAARDGISDASPNGRRQIHGEMGVMIGSHGTRGAYGAAAIPLGDNAGATVSFESDRTNYRR